MPQTPMLFKGHLYFVEDFCVCIKRDISLYSHPSVSMGNWFQDPLQIPKFVEAQVLYIKW